MNSSKIGFDNEKYLKMQSEHIRNRIDSFGGKLYLEFGGKLYDDYHASRVLPGFKPDSKLQMLMQLKDEAEIDLGITYDVDVLRLFKVFTDIGLYVSSVVLTQYEGQRQADAFQKRLESFGVKVYHHYKINGYPSNLQLIMSDEGYGKNDYIRTERKLVVITAPGPGSGKMATCLSQLYHEYKRGVAAGYAKFETFPIWNLPLRHPVNLAYEAATSDLNDVNMIDPFHLEAYGKTTVNYNRDVEIFPVLNAMFEKIMGESPYKSPTDMGVNMAGNCIIDDDVVCRAAKDEIVRRYYVAMCGKKKGFVSDDEILKLELLMNQAGISVEDRVTVPPARQKHILTGAPAAAIELSDGKIITGKTSELLGCSSAMLLNALKYLAGISDNVLLILPEVIKPIQELKVNHLGDHSALALLHIDELLIALSISAVTDGSARAALEQLPKLKNCEMHTSVLLAQVDENVLKKLGIRLTTEKFEA